MQSGRQTGRQANRQADRQTRGGLSENSRVQQGVLPNECLLTGAPGSVSVSGVSFSGGGRSRLASGAVGSLFKAGRTGFGPACARSTTHCFGSGEHDGARLFFTRRNLSRFHYFTPGKGFSVALL